MILFALKAVGTWMLSFIGAWLMGRAIQVLMWGKLR